MTRSNAAPHPSGSRVPIALIFSGELLWHFKPGMITREICRKTKTKHSQQSIQNTVQPLGRKERIILHPPGSNYYFARLTSTLADAGQSQLPCEL